MNETSRIAIFCLDTQAEIRKKPAATTRIKTSSYGLEILQEGPYTVVINWLLEGGEYGTGWCSQCL
jgi:hypothetical protein